MALSLNRKTLRMCNYAELLGYTTMKYVRGIRSAVHIYLPPYRGQHTYQGNLYKSSSSIHFMEVIRCQGRHCINVLCTTESFNGANSKERKIVPHVTTINAGTQQGDG